MVSYTVRRGATLGRIARRFYGDAGHYSLIVAANRIPDPDRLAVGRKLVIPDPAPSRLPRIGLSLRRLDRPHPAVLPQCRNLYPSGLDELWRQVS